MLRQDISRSKDPWILVDLFVEDVARCCKVVLPELLNLVPACEDAAGQALFNAFDVLIYLISFCSKKHDEHMMKTYYKFVLSIKNDSE